MSFDKALAVLDETAQKLGDGVLWIDEEGNILVANPAVGRILGRPESALRGRPFGEVDPLFRGSGWGEHWDMVSRHGPLTYESVLQPAEGGSVEVEMTLSAVSFGDRRLLAVMVREISQRRRAERQIIEAKRLLEECTRLKNEYLVALSHQIRTPLNSVMGATSLLLEEVSDPELLGLVRIVMRGERQLLVALGSIDEVVQLEQRVREAKPELFEIGPLVRAAAESHRPAAVEKRLALDVVEAEEGLLAWGVPSLVNDILGRLIDNAIQYTKAGSITLRLSAQHEGDRSAVVVRVEDTGVGMEPEFCARIFHPLVQDPQQRHLGDSRGMGLAIAHLLARLQGGSLTVESTKAVGSVFTLTLPVEGHRS